MAGSTYNYRVVVDMEIDPQDATAGANRTEQYLDRIERQVRNSQKRITDIESQYARQRYDDKVRDFNRQMELARKNAQFEIDLERRKNQSITAERARMRQETFHQQQQAFQREQELIRRNESAARSLNTQRREAVRAQTTAGAAATSRQTTGVIDFAVREREAGLANISRVLRAQELDDADRRLKQLTRTTNESARSVSMWGQAFRGAFIGAVAGLTFSLIIGGIFEIGRTVAQAGIAAVEAAARFQTTTKALEVFAGTTARAREELAAIDATARATAGLRMETAEQGYTRLRALGFQAEQARSFIKELGEEKILSGASDEALDRIIFNFAQIASGGQKVSQELREILTQMPSLRNAFFEAFESLDPKKIQQFFDQDTDAAFKRLTDAMARQKAASGGLEDAWGKLQDQFTQAGREFGQPILDPLTETIKMLTKYLYDNASTWQNWGQIVGDTITGLNSVKMPEWLNALLFGAGVAAVQERGVVNTLVEATFTETTLLGRYLKAAEEAGRERRERQERLELQTRFNRTPNILRGDNTFDFDVLNAPTPEMQRAQQLKEQENQLKEQEKQRQKDLQLIDSYYSRNKSIREQYFEESVAANKENTQTVFEITQQYYKDQIADAREYYNTKIEIQDGTAEETIKLEIERDNTIRAIETKANIERLKFEREELEKRRELRLAALDVEKKEIEQDVSRKNAILERKLAEGNLTYADAFEERIRIENEGYERLSSNEKNRLAEQLSNIALTEGEKIILRREFILEEQRLEEEHNQNLFRIQQDRLRQQKEQMQDYMNFVENLISARSGALSALSGLIFGEGAWGSRSRQILDAFMQANDESLSSIRNGVLSGTRLPEFGDMERFEVLNLRQLLASSTSQFARLNSSGRVEDVDEFEAENLINRQRREMEIINRRIKSQEEIILLTKDENTLTKEKLVLAELLAQRTEISITQLQEQEDQYRKSIEGIRAYNKALLEGDKQATLFAQNRIVKAREGRTSNLLESILAARDDLVNGDFNRSLQIQLNLLEKIVDLRNEEFQAISRIQIAQIDFDRQFVYSAGRADADFAEFLASQKGITEILSDARINAVTTAYDGLDQVAKSLAKNFGIAAKAVEDLISSLLKLGLNYIFRKFLGGDSLFGGGGRQGGFSFGGFQFPQIGIGGTAPTFPTDGNLSSIATLGGQFINENGQLVDGSLLSQGVSPNNGGLANFGGTGLSALGGLSPLITLAGVAGGAALGRGSISGSILGGIGGLLGTTALGGLLTGGHFLGSGVFGSLGSFLGIGGAATAGLALAVAPIILAGAYFIGRSQARRRDEKIRNQAMIDALKGLDDLITKVNNDAIDGAQALAQAEQIRQSYVEQMSQLKTKKTREIALKDVSRLDAKISQLKQAVGNQTLRRERLEQSIPTFADGGATSFWTHRNFKNNPLGYQSGGQSYGYFPESKTFASFNERGSEYIFDAETTRNIGIQTLDRIRQDKGRNLLKSITMPQMESGGSFIPPSVSQGGSGGSGGGGLPVIKVTNNITYGMQDLVETIVEAIYGNDGSRQQIAKLTDSLKNNGNAEFVQEIIKVAKARGYVRG